MATPKSTLVTSLGGFILVRTHFSESDMHVIDDMICVMLARARVDCTAAELNRVIAACETPQNYKVSLGLRVRDIAYYSRFV